MMKRGVWRAGVALAVLAWAGAARAAQLSVSLSGHVFSPVQIIVPANTPFILRVTSHDATPDEFESADLRVEKILMPGQTIIVHLGPLEPGTYKFFDDFHPETANGIVLAK